MGGLRIAGVTAAGALVLSGGGGAQGRVAWCKTTESQAWRSALARAVVPLSRRVSLTPLGAPREGRRFFAALYSRKFSGVVEVDARTSRYVRIHRFAHPDRDQAVGSFGGRWLVWQELHTADFPSTDFAVWSYDARTGAVSQIGAAERDPQGNFWPSPGWRPPDVRDGYATWAQGSGPDQIADVHVYDLAAGTDRIVRHGRPQNPFLISGERVVWPESLAPGAMTRLEAASAATGHALRVPAALRPLRGVYGLATDGKAVAYSASRDTALWWSPSLRVAPRRVFRTRGVDTVDNSVQIAGRYVFFGVQPHSYVADTKAGRYVDIGSGWSRMSAVGLVLLRPVAGKSSHPLAKVVLLRRRDFPPIGDC